MSRLGFAILVAIDITQPISFIPFMLLQLEKGHPNELNKFQLLTSNPHSQMGTRIAGVTSRKLHFKVSDGAIAVSL
jgi:hypothetical protein